VTTFTAPQTIRRPRAHTVAIGAAAVALAIGVGIGTNRIIDNQTSDGGSSISTSVDLNVPRAHDPRTTEDFAVLENGGLGAGAAAAVPAVPSAPPWDAPISLIDGQVPPGVVAAVGPSVLTSPLAFEQFVEGQVQAELARKAAQERPMLDGDGQYDNAVAEPVTESNQGAVLNQSSFEQLLERQVGPH